MGSFQKNLKGEQMTRYEIINSIPNIKDKKYLEIGIQTRWTFDKIKAGKKIGVDVWPPSKADFIMTSDQFFEINKEKFDIIFIDANHTFDYVVRDYNNSVKSLNPQGVIFIHDLFPPDLQHVVPTFCGDGFKLLLGLLGKTPFYVFLEDFGFTLFPHPTPIQDAEKYKTLTYDDLLQKKGELNIVSDKKMCEILNQPA